MLKRRLVEHAKKAARVIAAHLMRRTITEIEVIPEHDERSASAEYLRNRERLIEKDGIGCWLCGGRKDLEAHHWFEWAAWNEIDPVKAAHALRWIDFHGYGRTVGDGPLESPDAIANLVVLCRRDHRGKGFGIHNTTGPVWWARWARKKGARVVQEVT